MQGTIKNSPGPFAPPDLKRPRRKMTALSYSLTIFTQKKTDRESDDDQEQRAELDESFHATVVAFFLRLGLVGG